MGEDRGLGRTWIRVNCFEAVADRLGKEELVADLGPRFDVPGSRFGTAPEAEPTNPVRTIQLANRRD